MKRSLNGSFLMLAGFLTLAAAIPPGIKDSNHVVIRTSDDSVFRGSLEDKDGNLVTIRTENGEDLNLPVEEILSINGIAPSVFFKKFIPSIPDSLFSPAEISANSGKVRMLFKFLGAWNKSKIANGFLFAGPDDDRRWEGFRFMVTLESPPSSIKGEFSYKGILKKASDGGSAVLSESYQTVLGTETLRTTEVAKGNLASRTLRQLRVVNGEKCLLELILSHQMKEKLNQPMAIALFEKVVSSIQFPPPVSSVDDSSTTRGVDRPVGTRRAGKPASPK